MLNMYSHCTCLTVTAHVILIYIKVYYKSLLDTVYPCIYITLPVPSGVVQRAASPHRLKVIDAPSHERNSSPEDGQNPDDAAHRQSSAPEELLSYRINTRVPGSVQWVFKNICA